MKKIIALLLIISMLFVIVSCNKSDVEGTISENTTAPQSDAEPQEQVPGGEDEFEIGTVTGHTYTNEFLDLSLTMDDSWYLYSEEELAQLNNITYDSFDEEYNEKLKSANSFYDMFAQNMLTGETVNLMYEKVNALATVALDEEDYMDITIDSFSHIDPSSGMSVASCEKDMDSTLAGRTVPSLELVMEQNGIQVHERCFIFKKGMYFAGLSIAALSDESLNEIISLFTPAN